MAAPKDSKKSPLTLDLDIKPQPTKAPVKAKPEDTEPQFKNLNVTVLHPSQPSPPASKKPRIASTKTPQSKKLKLNPVAVLAGALIAGFLLSKFIGSAPSKAPQSSEAAAPVTDTGAKAVPTDQIPARPVTESAPVDRFAPISAANLSQLGTRLDDKGQTFFSLKITPKPSCMPGDMEAMRNVFGKTGSVLLSMEPMADGPSKIKPITRTVSLKEIEEGAKFSLPINLKETGVYGIYLCGDANSTGKCGGKKPADFNRILNFQKLEESANDVFYYQFSVIGLDYATVYTGLPNGINAARDQILQRKPKEDWKPQLDKAAGLMQGVKSLPPRTVVEGNLLTLELEIPMISPLARCR